MKRNVKLLTRECCEDLLAFKSNEDLRGKYRHSEYDNSSLIFLKGKSNYLIDDDFELGTSPKDDCSNSIELFKQLFTLDKVQANDKRLWVSLTHTIFYKYVWKRWDIGSERTSDGKIVDRLHFEGAGIDSRMGNAIARLWWTAKVTFDKKRSDEFELTTLIWEKQDIQVALMERSFSCYPNIIQGFLEFYKVNKTLKEDELRTIIRGLNAIGGVKMLPLLTVTEVIEEIKRIADYSVIPTS